MTRFEQVMAAIDATNALDPRLTPEGKPFELDQAEKLSDWVCRLQPSCSEFLRIAARGQHIERWTSPRSTYPEGRSGYLRWREDLKKHHARRTGELMVQSGYTPDAVERVTALITKAAHRAGDPDGIVLEDGLCLVFLETQLSSLLAKTSEEKMTDILQKTWNKMSLAGRAAAQLLSLSAEGKKILSSLP